MTLTVRDAGAGVGIQHRYAAIGDERTKLTARQTVIFPLSSEAPYRRWGGNEILDHDPEAVDLGFLNSGNAPLLYQHDPDRPIGVVERAWLDDETRRVYVEVRFSNNGRAQEVKRDVEDGIMRNVSVGYNVLRVKPAEREDGSKSGDYHVTRWKPMEASFVSIPADESVGIGRNHHMQEGIMSHQTQGAPGGTETRTGGLPPANPAAATAAPAAEQRNAAPPVDMAEVAAQQAEIYALARSHNMGDRAQEFIGEALRAGEVPSLARFRGLLRSELPDDVPLVNTDVGMNQRETQRFSIMKLARSLAEGATSSEISEARFEMEACEQAARNHEGETKGWRLPEEVMRNWSNFEVDGIHYNDVRAQMGGQVRAPMATGGHPNVQSTDHLAGRFIENLRNMSSIMRAGITTLPGLNGNVEIPGGDTNSSAGWLGAEGADAPETAPTFRKVDLNIKDIAGYTDLTRRMLMQSTIAMEAYVRNQLLMAVAEGIDLGGLSGSGLTGVPTGIKNVTGIGAVTFAALGAPTRAEVIEMWKDVAQANAAFGNLAFLSNALMVGHFMNAKVDAGSGKFMMEGPDSPLLSTRHIMSNAVADNDLFYGNWADLLMGMWGGLDLARSTEALLLSGGLRIRAIQSVDFGVRRVGSFCLGNGGI